MRLRTAFVLSLLAVLTVMAVPALFGVRSVRQVREVALDLRERTAAAAFKVGRVQTGLERLERYQRAHVATGDPELAERARAALRVLQDDLTELAATGYGDAIARAAVPTDALDALSSLTILLMESGLREEATTLLRLHLVPLLAEATQAAEVLAGAVDATTAARLQAVDRITGRAVTTTTTALLLALLAAAALSVLAARFLTRPLNRLSSSMGRVADGHFEPPAALPYQRHDEIGDLFRAFRSMALQLADLDRMKAEFVGIASHDLKTPINVISGYSELLAEDLGPSLDDEHREVLQALQRQSRTLSARVNQLLEISRIQAAGLRLGLEEINVRHFVSGLERVYAERVEPHGIHVSARVDDSAPSFVIADPDVLRNEVFANLLDNAIKYTPRGGRIEIRASGDGGSVTFEVADTGPPVAPEAIPFLFDRYHHGRTPSGRLGAGLDLPIAGAAVAAHGGAIDVTSPPDGGSVFRVALPIRPAPPPGYPERLER